MAFLDVSPQVRVRLFSSQRELHLQGLGVHVLGKAQGLEKVALPRMQTLSIQREFLNGKAIWKVSRNNQVEIVTEKFLALRGTEIRQGGKSLPSQIFLAASENLNRRSPLAFDVIGLVPLESYLVGVLASEMPLSWPIETLKAQAIAARSYALVTMQERSQQIYHLESSILDQVFNHVSLRDNKDPFIAKAREAVKQTTGQTLVFRTKSNSSEKILKAYYHSDCGGRTTNPQNVWGAGVGSGVVTDDYCLDPLKGQSKVSHGSWSLQLSADELTLKMRTYLKRSDLSLVNNISLIRSNWKERVESVTITFLNGEKLQVLAQEFRSALGYERLKSTLFAVSQKENYFQFVGQGFGHGVGLCQWGSMVMGKQGLSSTEILAHYYPRAQIRGPRPLIAGVLLRNSQKLEPQIK